MDQVRVVGRSAADFEYLNCSSGLPSGATQGFQEGLFADQPRAGTRQENPTRRHDLKSETVHIQIALYGKVHGLAVPRLPGGIENDDIETLPARDDVSQPG